MKNLELKNQVSIITGGSRGIGASIAEMFSKNGSKIIIFYSRDTDSARKVKKKLKNINLNVNLLKLT